MPIVKELVHATLAPVRCWSRSRRLQATPASPTLLSATGEARRQENRASQPLAFSAWVMWWLCLSSRVALLSKVLQAGRGCL